jgi:hypothetical protein
MPQLLLSAIAALTIAYPSAGAFTAQRPPCPVAMRAAGRDTLRLRALLSSQLCSVLAYADSAAVPVSLTLRGPSSAAISALRDSLAAWGYDFGPPRQVQAGTDSVAPSDALQLSQLLQGTDSTGTAARPASDIRLLSSPPGWYISGAFPAPSAATRDSWIAHLIQLLEETSCQLAGGGA